MANSLGKDVHIRYFGLSLDNDRTELCFQYLSNDEKQRAARFKFDKHRRRFIVSRGTQRLILAQYLDCEPGAMEFGYGEYGKPYVNSPEHAFIRFSVSNSEDYAAIALAQGVELGLDIEMYRVNPDRDLIISQQFTEEEQEWFSSLSEKDKDIAFYRMWTCKEAYLKGIGIGLNAPLNSFSINFSDDVPQISWTKHEDKAKDDCWALHWLDLFDDTASCLAIKGGSGRCKPLSMAWQRVVTASASSAVP